MPTLTWLQPLKLSGTVSIKKEKGKQKEEKKGLALQMETRKAAADAIKSSLQPPLLPRLPLRSELGKHCQVRIVFLCSGPDSRDSPGE